MKVAISQVCFYLDYNLDDSYTGTSLTHDSFIHISDLSLLVNANRNLSSKFCQHFCFCCVHVSLQAKKVSIRSGTSSHDLIDITAIELNEPVRP